MSDPVWIFLGCAVATYVTRIGGHLILSRFGTIHHRVEAALDAVPIAVLTALVAPSLISKGLPEALTLGVVVLLALRFSMLTTVLGGLIAVVVFRAIL